MRMVEQGDGSRFAIEAFTRRAIRSESFRQHLDGDFAIEPRVTRAIHLAHTAGAEERHDFVRPEASAWTQRHVLCVSTRLAYCCFSIPRGIAASRGLRSTTPRSRCRFPD